MTMAAHRTHRYSLQRLVHTFKYIYIYIFKYIHKYIFDVYNCAYTCMIIYVQNIFKTCMFIFIYICLTSCIYIWVYIDTNIYIYIYTYIYVHMKYSVLYCEFGYCTVGLYIPYLKSAHQGIICGDWEISVLVHLSLEVSNL